MGSCYSSHSGLQQSFDSSSRPLNKKKSSIRSSFKRSKSKRKASQEDSRNKNHNLELLDGSEGMELSSKGKSGGQDGNTAGDVVKRKTGSKLPKFGIPKTNKVRDIVEKHEAREKQTYLPQDKTSDSTKKVQSETQSIQSYDSATRSTTSSDSSAASVIAVQNLQPQASVHTVQISTQSIPTPAVSRTNMNKINNNSNNLGSNDNRRPDNLEKLKNQQSDILNANVKPVIPTTNVRFLNSQAPDRSQVRMINTRVSPAKFMTHISGLPKPQTAQVVSTSESLRRFIPSYSISSSSSSSYPTISSHPTSKDQVQNRNEQATRPGLNYHGPCPYRRPFNNLNVPVNKPITSVVASTLPETKKSNVILSKTSEVRKESREIESESVVKSETNAREVPKHLPVFSRYAPSSSYFYTSVVRQEPRGTSRVILPEKVVNTSSVLETDNSNLRQQLSPELEETKRGISFSEKNSEPPSRDSSIDNTSNSAKNSPERMSSVGSNSDRDFLIDDEISDQPELVLSSTVDHTDTSIRNSLHELEVLRNKQSTEISSSSSATSVNSSPCTVISSTNFRKPRALSVIESPDGNCLFDGSSFRNLLQDMNGIKTLLFRLQGLLQNAETQNPFEHQMSSMREQNTVDSNDDATKEELSFENVMEENMNLRRQVLLLTQQNEEKQRTIKLLQQQMTKYISSDVDSLSYSRNVSVVNAATQTERSYPNGLSPRAMSDGSNGMLISDADKLVNGDCYPCLQDHDT